MNTDGIKERINFLTKLALACIGIITLTVGGLIGLYKRNQFDVIFWSGLGFVVLTVFACVLMLAKINSKIKELEEL